MTDPGDGLGADDPPQAAAEATVEVIEPIEAASPDLFGIIQQEYYTGPVPHPDVLKGYEEVLPGSAEQFCRWPSAKRLTGRPWNAWACAGR